ncbi:MAG: hypothetical protein QOF63_1731 [Thermoanaerobaculia bacterium]|jgi:hypothetical protein|nr:hypothetical protein [Thermoanaerobaculia bacterium]
MRVCRALLALALLLSRCATASGERIHVAIWNDDDRQHTVHIEIDGQRFFHGIAGITQSEPSIVCSIDSHLNAGRHHVEVRCDNVTRSIDFEVRRGTRSNLHIHVKRGSCEVDVAYGDLLYM